MGDESGGSSFKKGSGSLDFGDAADEGGGAAETDADASAPTGSASDAGGARPSDASTRDRDRDADRTQDRDRDRGGETYPYFVRRSNVSDERTRRIEVFLRDAVADAEASFRADLAAELGTDEVAKGDARELALKYAFQHPEAVARLMENEGYGELD